MILYLVNIITTASFTYYIHKWEIRPEDSGFTSDEEFVSIWWTGQYDENSRTWGFTTNHAFTIIVFANWFSFILVLWGNKFFGVLINIFFSMLYDLVKFLVLYGVIFMLFVFVFNIALIEYADFLTIWSSIKKTFEIAMG